MSLFSVLSLFSRRLPVRNHIKIIAKSLLILNADVNPPVHAWSVFRVFKIERKLYGRSDLDFLGKAFGIYVFAFMEEC